MKPSDWVIVHGSGEWSILWDTYTGQILEYGDHDNVYDYIVKAVGIVENFDMISNDWVPDGRTPVSYMEATERMLNREGRTKAASELREQAAALIEKALTLETNNVQ